MVPINPWKVLIPSVGSGDADVAESARVERRRRPRVRAHWPILLFRQTGENGDATIESFTQNLSSQGFYYLSGRRFTVGEYLLCRLQILPDNRGGGGSHLECRVQVVRVEDNVTEGLYGIACRTEDYRFVAGQADRSFPDERVPGASSRKSGQIPQAWGFA
jgi:hypothetical protein